VQACDNEPARSLDRVTGDVAVLGEQIRQLRETAASSLIRWLGFTLQLSQWPLVSAESLRHELGIERRTKAGRGATPHYLRPAAFKKTQQSPS